MALAGASGGDRDKRWTTRPDDAKMGPVESHPNLFVGGAPAAERNSRVKHQQGITRPITTEETTKQWQFWPRRSQDRSLSTNKFQGRHAAPQPTKECSKYIWVQRPYPGSLSNLSTWWCCICWEARHARRPQFNSIQFYYSHFIAELRARSAPAEHHG